MDTVTPITGVHLGMEYRGEVVRAGRRSRDLGLAPGNGSHFKIVLLQEPPKNGLPVTVGPRTAVCVPASRSGRQAHRIIAEITAAKRAAYLTRRDVDAAAINSVLKERQHDLEGQLLAEEYARFFKGAICAHDGPAPNASEIYTHGDPVEWMGKLAGWLLARSYPSLPLDAYRLPDPIREADAGRLFASIFGHAGADPELLGRFGPALGLSSRDMGGSYEPSGCRVFSLIRDKLNGGPAAFDDAHRYLAYEVGLTEELASLLLLLFVQHERPEHQIQLTDDAAVLMADGGALLSTRLTPDLIPLLAWDWELAANAASIGPASAPSFSDARHHLSFLCPKLGSSGAASVDAALTPTLEALTRDAAAAARTLDFLETPGGSSRGATGETSNLKFALDRLGRIAEGGHADVYHSVRATYHSLLQLKDDLETLRQLADLDKDSKEIFESQRYLARAQVPTADFPNLAVDRDTLLTGLSPSRLVRSKGSGWSAIARDAEAFKIRYTQAYRNHHRQFHDGLPGFQSGLLASKKKSAALQLLDTISELGAPVGSVLDEELAALPMGPPPCSFHGRELDLSKEPHCPECRISLEQTVPSVALARLVPQIDVALGRKNRELSRRLVEKVMTGSTDERWLEFLQVVQASELSSLANTLDPDLVSFIKEVLD